MTTIRRVLILTLVAGLAAGDAIASGVGASYFVPGTAATPTSGRSGSPVASCGACQRLGFACVDHATVPPCTAEGGCYPARDSFGFHKTNWRRWPGSESSGPAPAAAGAKDTLLPPYEEPAPEEEDQQAPPPIEDEDKASSDNANNESVDFVPRGETAPRNDRPGSEINLPALPESPFPTPRPQATPPSFQNEAPSLPFGYAPQPDAGQQDWAPPSLPFGSTPMPASLPKPTASGDAPPPLPVGFTNATPAHLMRRLPTTGGMDPARYDASVRPASAQLPTARAVR